MTGPGGTTWELLRSTALACTRCPLAKGRTQVVFGVGDPQAGLLFVGEGPGHEEDLAGEPFVGRSGKLLDRLMLEEIGLTRAQCYIANVVGVSVPVGPSRADLPPGLRAARRGRSPGRDAGRSGSGQAVADPSVVTSLCAARSS